MPAAVPISREEDTAEALRRLATASRNAAQSRRLLAVALVLDGASRAEAARLCGMDRQTLRDWVHRFNAEGPAGLINRPAPGPACRLSEAQLATLAEWVENGPDPAVDGIVRWRCADLAAKIETAFGIGYSERGVGVLLRRLGFSHISARPQAPAASPEAQAAFKKTSPP